MTAEPLSAAATEVRRSRFYAHLYRVERPVGRAFRDAGEAAIHETGVTR
ncbi:MAG: hypothetical protein WCY70_04575 [Methanoculleus sp.]